MTAAEPCAHCGGAVPSPSARVAGHLRTTLVVYCSATCRDDHLVALALASPTCAAPGCDLDPAADVPFCDAHLDPALGGPDPGRDRAGHAA